VTPTPPENLPTYRLLTGPDDAAFCRRVSDALALGFQLHGSPSITFNGQSVIAGQAVLWPGQSKQGVQDSELLSTVERMEAWLQSDVPVSDPLHKAYLELKVRFANDLAASTRDIALAKASALMLVQAVHRSKNAA
jgi:hypothetical protein